MSASRPSSRSAVRPAPRRSPRRLGPVALALTIATLPLLAAIAPAQRDQAAAPTVRVSPAVELTSIVFRLAGNPEYSGGRVPGYAEDVEAWFREYENHAVIRLAARLRAAQGVSFDAVASLAVHLEDDLQLRPLVPLTPRPDRLDQRWKDDAPAFVEALRDFAKETRFARFWKEHESFYARAVERMEERIAESAKLEWFEQFFGQRPGAEFTVTLAPLNGGQNYGPSVDLGRKGETLHCVLGVWELDDDGDPVFSEDVLATIVHEFCHSYCNPLVEAHLEDFEAAGERMFAHVTDSMRAQAYGNWSTMVKESLVRASVVRYLAAHGGKRRAQAEIGNQARLSFTWVGDLSGLLATYEGERRKHETLETFVPRITKWFEREADALDERMALAPKVVSITPTDGDRAVDPGTAEIVITFDKKMVDRSWSLVGGGPKYPELLGEPSYDADCKVLTVKVALEPDRDYEFWLNSGRYTSFRSADGHQLQPMRVSFRTAAKAVNAAAKPAPGGAPQVVSIVPGNGDQPIDPDVQEIVITFDQPMTDRSWSFVGGGPTFPKVTRRPSYDAERKVLTVGVHLRPGQDYEFWLNGPGNSGFKSAAGKVLDPVHVTFRTKER